MNKSQCLEVGMAKDNVYCFRDATPDEAYHGGGSFTCVSMDNPDGRIWTIFDLIEVCELVLDAAGVKGELNYCYFDGERSVTYAELVDANALGLEYWYDPEKLLCDIES